MLAMDSGGLDRHEQPRVCTFGFGRLTHFERTPSARRAVMSAFRFRSLDGLKDGYKRRRKRIRTMHFLHHFRLRPDRPDASTSARLISDSSSSPSGITRWLSSWSLPAASYLS